MENFNYRSTKDLATLFYGELGISPIPQRQAAQPSIEEPEKSSKSIQSLNSWLSILISLQSLDDKISVLKRLSMTMDEFVHRIISPGLLQGASLHPFLSLELAEISRMLKNLSDQSLSLMPRI